MPPFIPRKRRASTPPEDSPRAKAAKKATLLSVLDAEPKKSSAIEDNKAFKVGDGDEDSESSLSEIDSSVFEDVPTQKATKEAEDREDEVDWEDAMVQDASTPMTTAILPIEDLELTLNKNDQSESRTNPLGTKKGPSKIERQIRIQTHCMHVQFLLFHNLVRNAWICDSKVQEILVKQLPVGIAKEVEKWRVASGLQLGDSETNSTTIGKNKKKRGRPSAADDRNQHDWGRQSKRLEQGKPDLSRGDPLIPLLKVLSAYWKKRFSITAPGLRKMGYKPLSVIQDEISAFQNDPHYQEEHGEIIRDVEEFRRLTEQCQGSRDVGAQLFAALLRGLGIETRMVANLQPVGFGWTKGEEGTPKKHKAKSTSKKVEENSTDESTDDQPTMPMKSTAARRIQPPSKSKSSRKGASSTPIDLVSSDEDIVSNESELESVIDVTPSVSRKSTKRFDEDIVFPIYWTEVVSPITNEIVPVDPLILPNAVATTPELLVAFEPRGSKADKVKQVIAYVIAYSSDGTAKDVTTRYLKRHMWPGKTKGVRMPPEKVAVYNKRGKIKRFEEYDWFKVTMSGYARSDKMRTAVDGLEDAKDLVPQQPEKKIAKDDGDTLQSLKSSADFVLERFLRREEALRPGSNHVRTFASGKGEKAKEEKVFKRSDVLRCLSAESWHKEGRQIKPGENPMKLVPVRAVTLTRKREVEEAERETGEKMKQGLYAKEQTEYIIPPPIKDGIIPKNAYGNIDCFVPTMIPKGAVHIPLRGTVRICKRLQIDYSEAVTGFEFGNKRAVPVVTGVVVATENEDLVIDAWEAEETQRIKKEQGKQEKLVLSMWRKFLMGLRITERLQEEYGVDADHDAQDNSNPFSRRKVQHHSAGDACNAGVAVPKSTMEPDDLDGGFLLPGEDEEHDRGGAELIIEKEVAPSMEQEKDVTRYLPTPQSFAPSHRRSKMKAIRDPKADEIDEGSSELSDVNPTDPESTEDHQVALGKAARNPPKRTGRRNASGKSKAKIISHYFEEDNDDSV